VGPYSQWVAGTIAAKDLQQGYWWSPSNTQMTGPLGPDVTLYASVLDAASDVNNLNAQGILTVFNAFGTGLRVWGNRSAAYPTTTTPNNFISVRRTMDVIEESVELAMLQFIDQPISNALISAILASVNAFIRSLIRRAGRRLGQLQPGREPVQPGGRRTTGFRHRRDAAAAGRTPDLQRFHRHHAAERARQHQRADRGHAQRLTPQ
jgi:phage tail sheath protein FI